MGILLLALSCQREQLQQQGAMGFAVSESIPDLRTKAPDASRHIQAGDFSIVVEQQWIPVRGADTKAAAVYGSTGTALNGDPIAVWAYNMTASAVNTPSAWELDAGSGTSAVKATYSSGKWVTTVPYNKSRRESSWKTRWCAVAPWAAVEGGAATPQISAGTAPTLTYTVPAAVEDQHDLMVLSAPTAGRDVDNEEDVALSFVHALTAVRLRPDEGVMLTSATLSGVYDQATLNLMTGEWSSLSRSTATPTFPTTNVGTDAGIMMMIPQLLPAGAKFILTFSDGKTVEADISGHKWETGVMVTYRVVAEGLTTPLTIEPCEEGTTKITIPNPNELTYKWSIDGAAKESSADDPIIINADKGQKVALYQDSAVALGFDMITDGIQINKLSYVYGNVMSLASETGYASLKTCVDHQFQYLFSWYKGNRLLLHPTEPLVLPATTLAEACYESMFEYCTAMDRAPALPATTLAIDCYKSMFWGCESLKSAPALPATTLADYCYNGMFLGCESLTSAPSLPAATLAEGCYAGMFAECSSLTLAPVLPATDMEDRCYAGMFRLCKSLTSAPALPSTNLAPRCYRDMFQDCTSLETPPAELPATALPGYCYQSMFDGCTSLTTAPVIRATTLSEWSCWSMFLDCSSLVSVQDELYATVMEDRCYESMFERCASLVSAPALPATTLAEECYSHMFSGCTSLVSAPVLPATVAVTNCYMNMFQYCTNLNYVECNLLDRNDSNGYCCTDFWLSGTANSGTFKKNPAATWPYNHQTAPDNNEYHGVPAGWTIVDIE